MLDLQLRNTKQSPFFHLTLDFLTVILLFLLFLLPSTLFGTPHLQPISFSQLPQWSDQSFPLLFEHYYKTLSYLKRHPHRIQSTQIVPMSLATINATLQAMDEIDRSSSMSIRSFFERSFRVYQLIDDQNSLFTGYYYISLPASKTKRPGFETPLLQHPKLVGLKASAFTHADILQGHFPSNLSLAWVASPVDSFFLQVQGSGTLNFSDGDVWHVQYAGSNHKPYVSLGDLMVNEGLMTPSTRSAEMMETLLKKDATLALRLLSQNPSYVYFQKNPIHRPVGALGIPLVKSLSMAVDTHFLPLGSLLFLNTSVGDMPFNQVMLAHDKGGAIKGSVRGDIFFGSGQDAKKKASHLNEPGQLFVLIPLSFN